MATQSKSGLIAEMDKLIGEGISWLTSLPDMITNLGPSNYTLGLRFFAENKFSDAQFRFKVALWFQPGLYQAWYHLGNCYGLQKNGLEAIKCYHKALHFKPDYEEARLVLAIADPKTPAALLPVTYPKSLVVMNFTAKADLYDLVELKKHHYVAHHSLFHALKPHLGKPAEEALDIGCGTGLMGELLRPHATLLTGVDITPAMADRAMVRYTPELKPVYDFVFTDDLRDYMLRFSRPAFEIITAASLTSYVGGLAAVFDGVAKVLKPGGIFAFTTDPWPQDGYGFVRTLERFGHSESYVRKQAERVGLNILGAAACPLAENETGTAWVMQKPAK